MSSKASNDVGYRNRCYYNASYHQSRHDNPTYSNQTHHVASLLSAIASITGVIISEVIIRIAYNRYQPGREQTLQMINITLSLETLLKPPIY